MTNAVVDVGPWSAWQVLRGEGLHLFLGSWVGCKSSASDEQPIIARAVRPACVHTLVSANLHRLTGNVENVPNQLTPRCDLDAGSGRVGHSVAVPPGVERVLAEHGVVGKDLACKRHCFTAVSRVFV